MHTRKPDIQPCTYLPRLNGVGTVILTGVPDTKINPKGMGKTL